MTENETKEILEKIYEKYVRDCDSDEEYMRNNFAITEAVKALTEIQQYRAIGTVEECQEAREKQRARKPIGRKELKDFSGQIYSLCGKCPRCGAEELLFVHTAYCPKCGQAILWNFD